MFHIDTKSNHLADDLSRDIVSSFLCKVPNTNPHPTPVSHTLLDLLLDAEADWIFPMLIPVESHKYVPHFCMHASIPWVKQGRGLYVGSRYFCLMTITNRKCHMGMRSLHFL